MKPVLLRILLSLLLLSPAMALAAQAQTSINASASGYFYAPDGSLALVNIIRTQDANKVVTTELFYTFCGQTNLGVSCQQGDGIIPNSATTGGVNTNVNIPDTFAVQVDTSAVAGYRNKICTQGLDLDGDCLGEVPGTGGLISITWTRTSDWAFINTTMSKSYQLGKVVFTGSSLLDTFSARQSGTVLGVNAASGAVMATSSDSETLQTQFAARKVRK
jgi:hypothetical protein